MTNNLEKLYTSIKEEKQRSAWNKGVTEYALELVEDLAELIDGGYFNELDLAESKKVRAALLNGAADWSQYSWGGSALIYNGDIAETRQAFYQIMSTGKPGKYTTEKTSQKYFRIKSRVLLFVLL